jgi:hypothetical protein
MRPVPYQLSFLLEGALPDPAYRHAKGLQALIYRWIEAGDSSLSEDIHAANELGPVSITRLSGTGIGCLRFVVGVLSEGVLGALVQAVAESDGGVRLGADHYRLLEVAVGNEATWEDLAGGADPLPASIHIRTVTPTAMHKGGGTRGAPRKSMPEPRPDLYFGNWMERWARHCRSVDFGPTDDLIRFVDTYVALAHFQGGTEVVRDLDPGRFFIGFVGQASFKLLDKRFAGSPEWRALWALARMAEYSGTGVETMRGMGQTQIV